MIEKAIQFATKAHQGQLRKGGLPYIVHPLQVMSILIEKGVDDQEILVAAVLHDTVEDTSVTVDEIRAEFGERVGSLVAELTHQKGGSKLESFRAMSEDARTVKMADRLSNLSSMHRAGWTDEKCHAYAEEGIGMASLSRDASAAAIQLAQALRGFAGDTNS